MQVSKHITAAIVAVIFGALAGTGAQHFAPIKDRVIEKQVRMAASKHAWPDLTQDETIAIGENLTATLKGMSVSIFCNDSACDELAHDLDDAMQIADVGSTLERSALPLGRGFVIVTNPDDGRGKALADIIRNVTAGKLAPEVQNAKTADNSLLIAIGARRR